MQGDVIGLIDTSGNEVVKYVYDAWGKILSTTGSLASTLGAVQPFRYRSYVYDQETGLYYLRNRYFNASICRFLNGDSIVSPNLFAYCKNQPVIYSDPTGMIMERLPLDCPALGAKISPKTTHRSQFSLGEYVKNYVQNVWNSFIDIADAFALRVDAGFGFEISINATLFGIPVNLLAGANIDVFCLTFSTQKTEMGCEYTYGFTTSLSGKAEYVPVNTNLHRNVYHPYEGYSEGSCSCDLLLSKMSVCDLSVVNPTVNGEIGVGGSLYCGVGGSINLALDVELLYQSIIDFFTALGAL